MSAFQELRDGARGAVLEPGSPGFADAIRAHNSAFQHDPRVVVVAADAEDVALAVRTARRQGVPVLTQSTGHGPLRPTAEGVLVRTSRLDGVEIDEPSRTARVGAGAVWGDVVAACGERGLVPLGMASVASVGVAGYLLGGGMGPLGRCDGFGADHVLSIELVNAEGERRTVDAEHNPELFWAFRGGKVVPGVATAFTVRLAPAPTLFAATLTYPRESTADALAAYASWQSGLGDETGSGATLLRFPDLPQLPEQLRGRRFLQVDIVHVGDERSGRALLDRLTAAHPPATSAAKVTDPATWMREQLGPPPGPSLQRGMLIGALTPEVACEIVAAVGPEADAPFQLVEIRPFGGALGRPGPDSAVGGRTDGVLVSTVAPAPHGLAGLPEAFAALADRLRPWLVRHLNVNFAGPADADHPLSAAWPPEIWQRLTAIRRTYDPTGVFPAP